jgi:hypothetical protein
MVRNSFMPKFKPLAPGFTQPCLPPIYVNFEFEIKRLIFLIKKMLLVLTDVCPLLTKQYIQVGLQTQYIFIQFLDGLSQHKWYG